MSSRAQVTDDAVVTYTRTELHNHIGEARRDGRNGKLVLITDKYGVVELVMVRPERVSHDAA
jgi:hypothetical protein